MENYTVILKAINMLLQESFWQVVTIVILMGLFILGAIYVWRLPEIIQAMRSK